VVFTAEPDGYTNNNGVTLLGQNQTKLDTVIGSANYDIGHVFSTGGGGIASLSVPCVSGSKARGVTGLTSPTGDPFYIDYVAHEMGHQWSANHTFDCCSTTSCSSNRAASAAYEPGSGSTIMAYAGICGANDLQPHSDPYFHRRSLEEIESYSRSGTGNTCTATVADGNETPTVDAGPSYTIPRSTPFALTGSATDPDEEDLLTYCWEQFDKTATGHQPASPVADSPIFRSFNPTGSPTRIFPKVEDLVDGTPTIGELLPTLAQTLDFRLTVRDNALPAGGEGFDSTTVTVDAASGPFLVTAPNTAITWNGSGPHTVTWNVANTTAAPVSCAGVDIALSTDGGFTFGKTLAAAETNDGSADVMTFHDTATARVRVMCSDNIFFDISNADFTIADAGLFWDDFEITTFERWDAVGTDDGEE
jgi:hypothetical protein